jgi:hypothetical protein
MKGQYMLSQKDIISSPEKDDPIAISSFPIDSHDCQRVALKDGGVINEGTILPVRIPGSKIGYPYHVPYRSVLPKVEQCTNLLVPVALSSTHVAMSSLRIEGAWMAIGQGAGIAAALSANQSIAVQSLQYPVLRERLLAQGQVLALPSQNRPANDVTSNPGKLLPAIVLDNTDAELTGDWTHSKNFKPSFGSGYLVAGKANVANDGKASAKFRFKAQTPGRYEVLLAYSAHDTRAKNVLVHIASGTHETKFSVDQTRPLPTGEHFQKIGTAEVSAARESTIEVKTSGTTGFVILDAIKLVPLEVGNK